MQNPATGNFTWVYWSKSNIEDQFVNPVIEKLGNNMNNGYLFKHSVTHIYSFIDDSSYLFDYSINYETSAFADNGFHFVAHVLDRENNHLKLYIDGQEESTNTDKSVVGRNISYTGPLYIGRNHNYSDNWYYTGVIDDLRLYNRALSQSEIQALYNE